MTEYHDILTRMAHSISEFLDGLNPVLAMLFLRWGCLLVLLGLAGLLVRFRIARHVRNTLPAQVLAVVFAVVVGMAIPLEGVVDLDAKDRSVFLTAAILVWITIPFFLPSLLIRRKGYQEIARYSLYAAELVLLVIQLAVLRWR